MHSETRQHPHTKEEKETWRADFFDIFTAHQVV